MQKTHGFLCLSYRRVSIAVCTEILVKIGSYTRCQQIDFSKYGKFGCQKDIHSYTFLYRYTVLKCISFLHSNLPYIYTLHVVFKMRKSELLQTFLGYMHTVSFSQRFHLFSNPLRIQALVILQFNTTKENLKSYSIIRS